MFLADLENVVFDAVKAVNKEHYDKSNKDKKEIIVQIAQKFYDQFVDKPFNLPSWVDFPVKHMLIPIAIDFIVVYCKDKGIIESIKNDVISERAAHIKPKQPPKFDK